jgi:dystrophin
LINISANDIVEGNAKLTLGLVWNIIQHWQVRDVLRSSVYDIHATNLEKALLKWCQSSTRHPHYDHVNITNFTGSWKDGLAFNALIHRYRPHLIDYDELLARREHMTREAFAEHCMENAFSVAQRHLNIERLLDVEDVMAEHPDKKSIMMYVMCYFQVLSKPQVIIDEMEDSVEVISFFNVISDSFMIK